mgnify:CR=1 FL=1
MKLNKIFGTLMLYMCCSLSAFADEARQIAFPGAEGFGRYATGGRGGIVYHVTTLEDNNEVGSLRYAVNQKGKRIIVFDVAGTITLKSTLSLKNGDITIAGQTAPGGGICVTGYPFQISANNVIIRYMRFRVGNENVTANGADGWDGLGSLDQKNIIVDHCSVSWSIDECCSFSGCSNITLQWSLVSQSLVNAGHGKGAHGYGGNWGGSGASYHHNLLAHHGSRTPRLGPRPTTQKDERMDMRNNVIYNFGGNGCYGGEGMNVNIVNNYYKPGPGSPTNYKGKRIAGIGVRTREYCHDENGNPNAYYPMMHVWGKYYVDGNVNSAHSDVTSDNWTYGIYNQISSGDNDNTFTSATKDSIKLDSPIAYEAVTTHDAKNAYNMVLAFAGASIRRDALDLIMVSDTRNGTASFTGSGNGKGFINTQNDIKYSDGTVGLPTLAAGTAETDTDGDGMPDSWETANGLNPSDKADGSTYSLDKFGYYTNVEIYINSIVEDLVKAQNMNAISGIEEYYPEWKGSNGSVHNQGSVAPNGPIDNGETGGGSSEPSTPAETTKLILFFPDGAEAANEQLFPDGSKIAITGNTSKTIGAGKDITIDGKKYKTMKVSNGAQNTLTLPEGQVTKKLTFYSYVNKAEQTDRAAYWKEVGGIAYDVISSGGELMCFLDFENPDVRTYTLDSPMNAVTFTNTGEQLCYVLVVDAMDAASGIEGINADNNHKKGVMYNLSGQKVNSTYKGIVIMNGKKFILK